jgi:hypothetical protein
MSGPVAVVGADILRQEFDVQLSMLTLASAMWAGTFTSLAFALILYLRSSIVRISWDEIGLKISYVFRRRHHQHDWGEVLSLNCELLISPEGEEPGVVLRALQIRCPDVTHELAVHSFTRPAMCRLVKGMTEAKGFGEDFLHVDSEEWTPHAKSNTSHPNPRYHGIGVFLFTLLPFIVFAFLGVHAALIVAGAVVPRIVHASIAVGVGTVFSAVFGWLAFKLQRRRSREKRIRNGDG